MSGQGSFLIFQTKLKMLRKKLILKFSATLQNTFLSLAAFATKTRFNLLPAFVWKIWIKFDEQRLKFEDLKSFRFQVDLLTEAWDELIILGFAFSTATNPNLPRYQIT